MRPDTAGRLIYGIDGPYGGTSVIAPGYRMLCWSVTLPTCGSQTGDWAGMPRPVLPIERPPERRGTTP